MGGTFFQADHPNNPGNGIARWDGIQWQEMGGGIGNFVEDLFVQNNLLYCKIGGSGNFADAPISYFAAWNGHQWCGTPGNFARPPATFGFANDTLFCTFLERTTVDGDSVSFMNYFVGDYVNGPNAVCSTYDLGEEEYTLPKNELLVYPNPTKGVFTLQLPNEPVESLYIYDVNGKVVIEVPGQNQADELVVDLTALPAGMYFVKVNNTYHAKISKL